MCPSCIPPRPSATSHSHPASILTALHPYPALQVDHFLRFADDERQMPVVWHQCLLCFVQRYKDEIRPEDRGNLRKLCSVQHHYQVCVGAPKGWEGESGGADDGRAGFLCLGTTLVANLGPLKSCLLFHHPTPPPCL